MITIKTTTEAAKMREAGKITCAALMAAGRAIRPGITTGEIDKIVRETIRAAGAEPSFLGYGGFPASACISVDEEVIHGIPGSRVLHEGELVSLDVGAIYDGWQGDAARTFPVGEIDSEGQRLIDVTRECFFRGLAQAKAGNRMGDIAHAVQQYAEAAGFSVIRDYVGHGIGREMHEEPAVPNFGHPGRGLRLMAGMTLALEPMIAEGDWQIRVLSDKWTVVTRDGKRAAHYENTFLITNSDPVILTCGEEGAGL